MVADRLQSVDAILERRIIEIGDSTFDCVIEPLQTQLGLRRTPVQLRDMLAPPLGSFLPAIQNLGQHDFKPDWIEQPFRQMIGDKIVQPLHRHGHAFTRRYALPRLHRAGVIAIAPALAGADRHRAAALAAVDQSRQQRRAADDLRVGDLRAARLQMRLHRIEHRLVDDRRNLDRDHFGGRLQFLALAALVELVPARIGGARQHPMHRADAPAPTVAGEDTALVEMLGDRLDTHRAGRAVPFQSQLERQPHRVGVQRVDLQFLLGLGAALFGGDDAIADRWQRAIPEALSGVFLQGAQDVLGVLLGLILVEQRHDLAHHDVHRIITHLLGDREQLHAVLGELADVKLQLEVVTKEAREAVDHHHVERCRLARSGLDHALELGSAVVGGGCACLYERIDQLQSPRQAIGFALLALIRDRDVMLGLPRR